ncbi:MAG TPA: hypothetical protein VNO34_06045 [Actinomycetota bacterium]|nr:hypothetical protein [Actinomycetota bacterium]
MGSLTLLALAAACTRGPEPLPSPPPGPLDVDDRFLERIRSPDFTGTYVVEGTFVLGPRSERPLQLEQAGEGTFRGLDSKERVTFRGPGREITLEGLTVGGVHYLRTEDGPWVRQPSSDLSSLFRDLDTLDDYGPQVVEGRRVRVLRPPPFFRILPEHLGLDDPAVRELRSASVDLYAAEDGTPVGFAVAATWVQLVACAQVEVEVSSRYWLRPGPLAQAIAPPSDPWELHLSPELGYRMGHPPGWSVTGEEGRDVFRGPLGAVVVVRAPRVAGSVTLEDLVRAQREADGRLQGSEAIELDGEPARLLTFHVTRDRSPALLQLAVALHPQPVQGTRRVYVLAWASPAGAEEADRARFREFLSTFEFGC